MFTTQRFMGWFMLMLAVGGCTSYRGASIPHTGAEMGPFESDGSTSPVGIGDRIRIVLTDGTKVKGDMERLSALSLTLKSHPFWIGTPSVRSRIDATALKSPLLDLDSFKDQNLVTVRLDDITSVERSTPSHEKTTALAVGLVALAGLVTVGLVASSMDLGN